MQAQIPQGSKKFKNQAAIPTLLKFATNENKALNVAAWKALSALPRDSLTPEVKKVAKRVFYEIGGPKRDSSSRTIALKQLNFQLIVFNRTIK